MGRFQPFHLGHLHAIQYALASVDRLWVAIGSSNRTAQPQNPFSAAERRNMITSSVDDAIMRRIGIFEIPDLDDHQRWAQSISRSVPRFDVIFTNDETTAHIYRRREITVEPIPFADRQMLSGTEIRRRIYCNEHWQECVPDGTREVLFNIGAVARLKACNYK